MFPQKHFPDIHIHLPQTYTVCNISIFLLGSQLRSLFFKYHRRRAYGDCLFTEVCILHGKSTIKINWHCSSPGHQHQFFFRFLVLDLSLTITCASNSPITIYLLLSSPKTFQLFPTIYRVILFLVFVKGGPIRTSFAPSKFTPPSRLPEVKVLLSHPSSL